MYITVLKWIAPVLIILLALLAGEIHGRSVIRLQDAKANAFMAVQAQQARDKADAAQKQATGAQARFNDYLGSHPIEPIRVCVARPISVRVQPLSPELKVPAPDPLLALKCLSEAQQRDPISAPNSEPSCRALQDWLSRSQNSRPAD